METLMQHTIDTTYVHPVKKKSTTAIQRFVTWTKSQENNRLGWLAIIIAGHGCVLTPLTLFAVVLAGNSMVFWSLAIAAMGMSLITNLAAMPTKVTIPVFFFSVLIDVVIIVNCIAIAI